MPMMDMSVHYGDRLVCSMVNYTFRVLEIEKNMSWKRLILVLNLSARGLKIFTILNPDCVNSCCFCNWIFGAGVNVLPWCYMSQRVLKFCMYESCQ